MALLRDRAVADYWAEYGTIVVLDHGDWDYESESLGMLEAGVTGWQPGTIARAGAGYLWANGELDADHEVRLEAHDGEPPDDRAEWDDVMETPYRSLTGTIALTHLGDSGDDADTLLLGSPGHYRVRVSCRRQPAPEEPDEQEGAEDQDVWEGYTWRLQFWAAPGDREPPRWLARAPAVPNEAPGYDHGALHPMVHSVLPGAEIAARRHPEGMSAEQILAGRSAGGYGNETDPAAPLWPPLPRPLTTGHPDQDAFDARMHAQAVAEWEEQERELAEKAAELGVPAPVTVGDVLPLLVRMGLLNVRDDDGEARYRIPAAPDRPAGQTPADDEQELLYRSDEPAADLVALALWTRAGRVGTVADLAGRLLLSPDEVRAALRYAEEEQWLRVSGDPDEATSQLTLTALPPREERPAGEQRSEPLPPVNLGSTAAVLAYFEAQPDSGDEPLRASDLSDLLAVASVAGPAGPPPLPEGAPPRAGIVTTSGNLVVWRYGRAEVLAGVPGGADRAVETAYGVVVLSFAKAVLVRPGGPAEVLATGTDHGGAFSADGRYLALSETPFRRREFSLVHVIDLADGSRQTLQWPEYLTITGMHRGAVYFTSHEAGGLRWTPGSDPERLAWKPRTVDPITGAMLVAGYDEGADGWLVIAQDGERHNVLVTSNADLAPGGTHLIDFRYSPPAVTLFDVATGGADPRIWWLPEGCDTSASRSPAWEDASHLLFRKPYARDVPAVRLDVSTGEVEGVPFPGVEDGDGLVAFVESLR